MSNKDGLTEDERLAGGLANAVADAAARHGVNLDDVIAEMPAAEANAAHRARELGKQMRRRGSR